MITAIDTNVLLDLLVPGARYAAASRAALERADADGGLVISDVVCAEVASQFPSQASLTEFLRDTGIRTVPGSPESLWAAGRAWRVYRQRRPAGLVCPECGHRTEAACAACGVRFQPRQHLISDFQIGAHALHLSDRLLTRDRGFFRAYFEDLTLLVPAV